MEKWLNEYPLATFVIGLGLTVALAVVAYVFVRTLLRGVSEASGLRPPLVTAMSLLGILGIIGLIGALFTEQESAYTIAATVVGGLTGYLTAQAQQNRADRVADDWNEHPEPEPDDLEEAGA